MGQIFLGIKGSYIANSWLHANIVIHFARHPRFRRPVYLLFEKILEMR